MDDSKQIDDWYRAYRRDFMPDSSGRIFRDKRKSVKKRVGVPVRKFQYVGRGGVTNPSKCGQFLGWSGCLNHSKHKDGNVFAVKLFNSCDSPKCSCCYRAWASRLSRAVTPRLVGASKVFGEIEHVIVSMRKEDYDLSYRCMKDKCIESLKSCGFEGGYFILHSKSFGVYRPHFHVLCYSSVEGGAERCRVCTSAGAECYECDGVKGRCYRDWRKSGVITRVLGKRLTLGGTLFYEAEHCTIDYSKRRFRVGVWFGTLAYSNYCKLGVEVEKDRMLCPDCGSAMSRIDYLGDRVFNVDKDSVGFHRFERVPYVENDMVKWVVKESGGKYV